MRYLLKKAIIEVKVAVGFTTRKLKLGLEKTVPSLCRDTLLDLGIKDVVGTFSATLSLDTVLS